jgi:N-acetylglucosaminyldiphosphoundecaprenol N-acetyl-beta-D-mannosaminyltransferase
MTKMKKAASPDIRPGGETGRFPEVEILGTRVHSVSMQRALRALEAMAGGIQSHHVVTVNPEFIMTARKNPEFQEILNRASLAVPDGMGVVWAARKLGQSIEERVTGVDLLENFAAIAAERGFRIFLLGAGPGVAERAAGILKEKNPGLLIAGTYGGSPRQEEEKEICERIRAASPHVLFVAYGSPQQDLWIERNRRELAIPVCAGIGGSLDYIAGVVPRAPRWLREIGFEWLYRLGRQPRRWRRMLALPGFAWEVLSSLRNRRNGK